MDLIAGILMCLTAVQHCPHVKDWRTADAFVSCVNLHQTATSQDLGEPLVRDIVALGCFESGYTSDAVNTRSGARGTIQVLPKYIHGDPVVSGIHVLRKFYANATLPKVQRWNKDTGINNRRVLAICMYNSGYKCLYKDWARKVYDFSRALPHRTRTMVKDVCKRLLPERVPQS
jgi:hypothetical protein